MAQKAAMERGGPPPAPPTPRVPFRYPNPGPPSTRQEFNTTQLKADFLAFKKLFITGMGDTHDKEELV
jgi:hypothetical protein